MSTEQARKALQQGITAARSGDVENARQLLQEAIRRDPRSEAAWLWLSSVARDNQERIFCLKKVLEINPNNANALKGLQTLGADSAAPAAPVGPPPSIPLPDQTRVEGAMRQIDELLATYRPIPTPAQPLSIQWTHKRGRRAGEGGVAMLRTGAVIGAVAVGAVVLVVLYLVARGIGGTKIVLLITPSLTPSVTQTPTPTAGYTPTPSATPVVPNTATYTLPPPATPGNDIYRPVPTLYPNNVNDPIVASAQAAYQNRQYATAIPLFATELQAYAIAHGPAYDGLLFQQVRAEVDAGQINTATAALNGYKSTSAFYQGAQAYLACYGTFDYTTADQDAEAAYTADPNFVDAALIAANALIASHQADKAQAYLANALATSPDNSQLLVAHGQASLSQNDPDAALIDANRALQIDPRDENALKLNVQALLARAAKQSTNSVKIQAYGTAVLAAEQYLHYFPGSVGAWVVYGMAREGEGNSQAALDAYTQAVVVDQTSNDAIQAYLRRAMLYLSLQRYSDAYADFSTVIALPGTALEAHQGRLAAAIALQKYDIAQVDLDALGSATPGSGALTVESIDLAVRQGHYTGVIDQLPDALINGLDANTKALALLDRGVARVETGDKPDAALADLSASLALRESGLAHYYRGRVLETQKRYAAARIDYEWALYWNDLYAYNYTTDLVARATGVIANLPTDTTTPTPSMTRSPTNTLTPSNTPTASNTPTPSRTLPPSRTPTDTKTPSPTRTPTITRTPSPTRTPTNTRTPTITKTPSPTQTPTGS